jgi:hypothetical protein
MFSSQRATSTNNNRTSSGKSRQKTTNSMKSPTATSSSVVSNESTRIGCINSAAHAATRTNTNYLEVGVSKISVLRRVKVTIGSELDDQWIWMNEASSEFYSHD